MTRILTLSFGLAAAGCTIPELVTPESGSCPETITNRWPNFEGTKGERLDYANVGYNLGQVPPDFSSTDQFGEDVCLWQMVGNYVVLDASALWCVPCQIIAEAVACTQEAFGDDVVYMTFITEGQVTGTPATDEDVQNWSTQFGLDKGAQTPVINDGGAVFTDGFPGDGLPAFMLLGPDLEVLMSGEGEATEQQIRNELAGIFGVTAEACHSEE